MDRLNQSRLTKDGIRIYDRADFDGMRAASQVTAGILDDVGPLVVPGVTTAELDDWIRTEVGKRGAISATIGYRGYKHASCISLNHVVCHGIPGAPIPKGKDETVSWRPDRFRADDRILEGDILNIDVTVIVDGWYGDSSRMYAAGAIKPRRKRLIQVTHEALMLGIAAVKPGNTFGDIGHAIQSFVEGQHMSVVRDFCGHGVGRKFHDAPNVLHYGRPGREAVLEEGMIFTIEPMVNLGKPESVTLDDDWTAVTRDGRDSAQFEHSVGVTADGVEIFTASPGRKFMPAL